jgi:hypothetical protein
VQDRANIESEVVLQISESIVQDENLDIILTYGLGRKLTDVFAPII